MLMRTARTAVFWSGLDVVIRQGLQLGFSIALARLLSPTEFGTIALLYLLSGIGGAFVDGGLSTTLIQRRDATTIDESTVFWFNLGMAALVALAMWASSSAVASFYNLPVLTPLTWVMAINVFLGALGSIHATLLSKRLDFRTQMKISTIAMACSGALAVFLAQQGMGVWALAAQTLTATTLTTLLLWRVSSWRPALVFSLASARRLFGSGGYLLASQLLNIAYTRAYTLLIGRFFSARDLGQYDRANSIQQLPASVLGTILGRVSLPIFSHASQDEAQLRRGVQMALRATMLVNIPVMLGLAAAAEPVVALVLGPKWLPAVPYLRILCIGGGFWPLHGINLSVLMAQGYSHLYFRLEVLKTLVGLVFLCLGSRFGVVGIAWGTACYGAAGFTINAYYTRRHLSYGVWAQSRDTLPILAASLPMAVSVYCLGRQWTVQAWSGLVTQIVLGALCYAVTIWLFKLQALHAALKLFRPGVPHAP